MSSSGKSTSSAGSRRPLDPITRTALRYTISPREYELLHQYLISRAPKQLQQRTPNPPRYEKITESRTEGGEYNANAMRTSLRVFITIFLGFKSWEGVKKALAARKGAAPAAAVTVAGAPTSTAVAVRHPNARIALAFSSILLFHRLLFRFFKRLRASLLEANAEPFRKRNPGVTRALTSPYTPAIGASLAGFLLGVSPSDQLRLTIVIYILSRSLEFGYNALADGGYLWSEESGRPWWFGSWLIMPFACGQLLHAFVFDRDCFPESYGRFILARSPEYIQLRPAGFPKDGAWPGTFDIVDALADCAKLKWPAFVSPILFPSLKETLPALAVAPALHKVKPIIAPAFPGATHLSCALLHPHDPSCARTYLRYWIAAFPSVAKFFTIVYGAFALLAYKSLLKTPGPFLNKLSARILRMTVFITGSIGTSWASICLFNNYLPRNTLPTQRFFLGGFLGGLWAFVASNGERSTFLYSARTTIESTYRVGKKHGWWTGVPNGDVLVFVAALALTSAVHEARPTAVNSGVFRKLLSSMNGEGWVDRAAAPAPEKKAVEGSDDASAAVGKGEKQA
ncbi:uncharacterized protein K489DRAFT_315743 [Dissoconium aciculare CBS 342.82]|jgi:hypothetical protein|uniref:Transmembrane protein 135 N-terminal domain-containing protein n=1 Tax=Dissoconium aciculare CBS 342.82 TaxID=1314786 RepID=A0A6J3M984_9PEZI|nr:uncharacterized protein K489DRAFT_315743 [Dissoconium aciculare CBS 342.82]KAF1824423.1 hypothetical protein K489DRAFT_315743 [Dissoconium aciculare CBS 342.82]